MADFVSVLRRAVGNLEDNNVESRHAIYGKARKALRGQLEAIDPPLGPEEIDRQIAALDASIVELETEFDPSDMAEPEPATPDAPVDDDTVEDDAGQQADEPAIAYATQRPPAAQTESREAATARELARARTEVYDDDESIERGGYGRFIAWIILFLVVAGIVGVGFWQRDTVMDVVASLSESEQPADDGKIDDRLPSQAEKTDETATAQRETKPAATQADKTETPPAEQPTGQTSPVQSPGTPPPAATAEGERVAQALLIEESTGGVSPANSLGGVINWSLEDDAEAVGGVDKIIVGQVSIPEKDLALTVTIRRNKDKALPASHLIELVFEPGPGFTSGGVETVPGILMKATPRSTGQPLVGAVVPVMDGYFLVGLSEGELDRERNIQEMTARAFIDIPIAYKDGGRALLSLAKGEPGTRVFNEAFAAWGE